MTQTWIFTRRGRFPQKTHSSAGAVWRLPVLVLLALCGVAVAAPITLDAGQQFPLTLERAVQQVAIGDPAVADVQMISAKELLITALKPGTTGLRVWYRDGSQAEEFAVTINPVQAVREEVEAAGLTVGSAGDKVQLRGESTSLEAHEQALALATTKDAVPVDASRLRMNGEVQTDIKIVEISREKLRSAGVFLGKNTANTTAAVGGPGVLSSIETSDTGGFALNSASGFLPNSQAFNLVLGNSSKGLLSVFSLLEAKGFAYTLAEPSLVTMSGQSASFLAGGEFPIPVSQGSSESSRVTIEYKEFGVLLTLSPTVLAEDRIMLKVAPEVSELDFTAGVSSGGVTVPALRVRRADTSVELGDGESFVIAGLISQDTMANVDKLPGLGDLPVLGALFRSSRIEKNDRELVMIVTPHLVRPLARGSSLPPLPGERYRNYDKEFADQLFNEKGDFESHAPVRTGFSD
ncbi:MAG: type II and III secretion system protein family protein [Gammaproteobacteria bacterium]|nr:type II and III secretion system protein family protein [Gammaproteobacteria bacterium]